ncbi:MAG: major capsid protein [Arizlama microvirus]|nr:MAG: major capsid protein [Arizlama microvirus]
MKSVMSHQFSQVPKVECPRSQFDRSHGHKTTFMADKLVPFYIDEVLPGDTFKCDATIFARMATPIAPIMDNLYLDTFFFFVPYRLVWEHWINFMGEKENTDDTTAYAVPVIAGTMVSDDLADHFGLPMPISMTINSADKVSALPFRAYNLIYNQWFRDQNLIDSVVVDKDDGPDALSDYQILKRAKKHDYFTSSLPWPQKGDAVELPLGTTAPVIGNGYGMRMFDGTYQYDTVNVNLSGINAQGLSNQTGNPHHLVGSTESGSSVANYNTVLGLTTDAATSGLIADLSSATSATINSLREAFQLQRMLERDARSGNRYVETIKAHFGVTCPDYRVQRSEYLGGSSNRINISPVQQTAAKATADTSQTPLGTLGGFGVAHDRTGFSKSFTEHGIVIGLVNVRADLTYQQGLNRMWTRQTKHDFYWPALSHLGEQEVKTKEIYALLSGNSQDETIFGYQERYAEYRYYPSQITGQFRSTFATPLDSWHLSEKFGSKPELNQAFIESNTPMRRVLAVPGTEEAPRPHFIMDSLIQLHCARPMPVYGVPGLIDHF